MIRINQCKLPVTHTEADLREKAAKMLKIPPDAILSLTIVRQSVDARKKGGEVLYSYTLEIETAHEERILKRANPVHITKAHKNEYHVPKPGEEALLHPPVIIGSGPAGLFAGLMLSRAGYRPILLERGEDVDARSKTVDAFWNGAPLNPDSNVQFGEGGAGTFSDGKLNTLVKDPLMRNRRVLELFVEFGADPAILYQNKPHIGTDILCAIVKAMRTEILRLGGNVRFSSHVTDFISDHGRIRGITINRNETLPAEVVILAVGHSARDTFQTLCDRRVLMTAKPFAVGLRIQHPQAMIDRAQYGDASRGPLGAADYKLTYQSSNGRGVYSFCMCPGGFVVNASSERGGLAVNGMSYHARDGVNANSALIVTVTPDDFPDAAPLAGAAFQANLEAAAYERGHGAIPIQLYGDFKANRPSKSFGDVAPAFKGAYCLSELGPILPSWLSQSLIEGIEAFNSRIEGFSRPDAILAGIESRTSSPVRIPRDSQFESSVKGLYPCGEGAGYAGGITSAAMDGLKVAEAVVSRYRPLQF